MAGATVTAAAAAAAATTAVSELLVLALVHSRYSHSPRAVCRQLEYTAALRAQGAIRTVLHAVPLNLRSTSPQISIYGGP